MSVERQAENHFEAAVNDFEQARNHLLVAVIDFMRAIARSAL
jgi:hypothetical protein